jgi:N-acetyl-1-D-myo-inositol-2-amino-2-deoxy-alpha-D-glucopyranoside deacetylase
VAVNDVLFERFDGDVAPATAGALAMPAFTAATRLLVVSPHPDDESLGTGGLIQAVLAGGGSVDVLMLTDGDDNPWPQRYLERRLWIGAQARQRWGQRRRAEVASALARLGVGRDRFQALGWHDLEVTRQLSTATGAAIDAVAAAIARVAPTLIALPALGDRHPDHGAGHVLVRLAATRAASQARLLNFMVHGQPAAATHSATLPLTPALHQGKRDAVLEHRTQTSLSLGRIMRWVDRPEVFSAPEPASPVLPWRPSPALTPFLRLTAVDAGGARSWRWRDAPLKRTPAGWRLALPGQGVVFVKLWLPLRSPWIFDRWGWVEQGALVGATPGSLA